MLSVPNDTTFHIEMICGKHRDTSVGNHAYDSRTYWRLAVGYH